MPLSIVVVGNCQVPGIADCLQRLLPEAKVSAIFLARLRTREDTQAADAELAGVDVVFSQFKDDPRHPFLSRSQLEPRVGRVIDFPRLFFRGLQPDMFIGAGAGLMPSTNSALAMACYVCGLSEERTIRLFNGYIYERLGYFSAYAKSVAFLARQDRQYGFNLEEKVLEWRRDGAFMYTYNHPHLKVIWWIAQSLCEWAGLAMASSAEPPPDKLAEEGIWPVYPEIGRRIGIASEYLWRTARGETLGLEAFVSRCFVSYAKLGAARLRSQASKLEPTIQCIEKELGLVPA